MTQPQLMKVSRLAGRGKCLQCRQPSRLAAGGVKYVMVTVYSNRLDQQWCYLSTPVLLLAAMTLVSPRFLP